MGPQQHVIQSDPHANSIKNKSSNAQLLFTVTVGNHGENMKFSFLIGWAGILLRCCHAGVSCTYFVNEGVPGAVLANLGC